MESRKRLVTLHRKGYSVSEIQMRLLQENIQLALKLFIIYYESFVIKVQYRSFITSLLHACTRKETRHKYSKFTSRVCVDHVSRSV